MQNGKERCQKIDYFFFCMVFFSNNIRGFTNIYLLLEKEMENVFLFGKAFNYNLIGMFVKKIYFGVENNTFWGIICCVKVELRVSMKY